MYFRCGVEVRLWRAICKHRNQFKTMSDELAHQNINNTVEDINRNLPSHHHRWSHQPVEKSNSTSNCNSFESNTVHTTSSSDDVTTGSDEYESCNGGDS